MPILIAPLFAMAAAASAPSASHLIVENCQAGDVYAFADAECQLSFENPSDKPIRVHGFTTANDGDRVTPDELVVAPHARAYAKAKINAGNGHGGVNHVFHFSTDESEQAQGSASVFVFVMSALENTKPELDFETVDTSQLPSEKSIDLISPDFPDFRIAKVLQAPEWLAVSIDASGHKLSASLRPTANWGLHADFIKLATNSKEQPQVWVSAKADVRGEVIASSNPYDMGLMRTGHEHEFKLTLQSRGDKDFKVGGITFDGFTGAVDALPCAPLRAGCRVLRLRVANQQPSAIKGMVHVELPEFKRTLNIAAWGLLVTEDAKIKTLDPEKLSQGSATASTTRNTLDLGKAIQHAVTPEEPDPPGQGPLLKWTVANGAALHGFQIYRSDSSEGPFVLLNHTAVRANNETQDATHYRYRDDSAKAGSTYWYYIGIVYNDGHKQQLTGPQKIVAK